MMVVFWQGNALDLWGAHSGALCSSGLGYIWCALVHPGPPCTRTEGKTRRREAGPGNSCLPFPSCQAGNAVGWAGFPAPKKHVSRCLWFGQWAIIWARASKSEPASIVSYLTSCVHSGRATTGNKAELSRVVTCPTFELWLSFFFLSFLFFLFFFLTPILSQVRCWHKGGVRLASCWTLMGVFLSFMNSYR